LSLNTSQINTIYSLSYTDPYFTVDGISQGFDVYYKVLSPSDFDLARYETETAGGALRLGVPVSEIDTIQYGLGVENVDIVTFPDSPQFYKDYVTTFGNSNSNLFVNAGWVRDVRDSLIYPTKGTLQRASAEVGLPGGDLHYYKTTYQVQTYFPLSRNLTLMLNGDAGYGDGYDDRPLPFFKNFFAGGVNSVRGYKSYTVGPKDSSGQPRGGSAKLVANVELFFPFPGLQNDRSVRMGYFVDAGMVDDTFDFSKTRYSTGLSLLWISPLGPLKVSAAKAIQSQPGDEKEVFQFTIGGVF